MCAIKNLLITKILDVNSKGDFAQSIGMLEAIKTQYPHAKLSIFCRNFKDKKKFSKYGQVYEELFVTSDKKLPKVIHVFGLLVKVMYFLVWLKFQKIPISNDIKSIFYLYKNSDMIVNCGGGSLGGYGLGNLFLNAVIPVCIAKKCNKFFYHSSLTIEPPKGYLSKILTKFVLNNSNFITLREQHSMKTLESLNVKIPKLLTADYSFLIKGRSANKNNSLLIKEGISKDKKIKIGISCSSWTPPFFYRLHNHTTYDSNNLFLDTLCESLQQLLEKLDAVIVFFSMSSYPKSNDVKLAQVIKSRIKSSLSEKIFILSENYSPEELKFMIGEMDIFIGTRYHGVVFATSMLVPTISISYMQKIRGYMEMIGMKEFHIEYSQFSTNILVNTTIKCLEQRDKLINMLKEQLPQLEKKALYNVKIIEQIINSKKIKYNI